MLLVLSLSFSIAVLYQVAVQFAKLPPKALSLACANTAHGMIPKPITAIKA
jgi:hypothetical protein